MSLLPDPYKIEYLHAMDGTQTDMIELAARFVNRTGRNVFLTGKAGTGKTTFLKNLAASTYKKFVIVAPTGIAALNAGGVTIHSQFLLPPGVFVPDRQYSGAYPGGQPVITTEDLIKRHPLNQRRRQVLRDIDLLIIDEVSMLRADLLDAIDHRMRFVKRRNELAFGGVQVLMIGDLYQLPPVVKDDDWRVLGQYYRTPFFFESHGLKQAGFTSLELDKIFRQSDDRFVQLLNNLRDNRPNAEDIALLNAHYQGEQEPKSLEDVITLTTHNYKAEAMNVQALNALKGKMKIFRATVSGEFPETMYPVPERLELKIGAQVMFIKNDAGGEHYYNGKLARVHAFEVDDDDGEQIVVEMADDRTRYTLRQEVWQNKSYEVNESTKEIEEKVKGTFTHYPIKLAWAITVHKSQGLTFERAIIDVGQAFAPGQVYVALSRLRSLDGLVLRTRINPGVIATDPDVVGFSEQQTAREVLPQLLGEAQRNYLISTLNAAFDFTDLLNEADRALRRISGTFVFEDESMRYAIERIRERLWSEGTNLLVFRRQLERLLTSHDEQGLVNRLKKAGAYYDTFLRELLRELLVHLECVKQLTRTKTYLNELAELDLLLTARRERIGKSAWLAECILASRQIDSADAPVGHVKRDRVGLLDHAREVATRMAPVLTKSGRVKAGAQGVKKTGGTTKGSTLNLTWERYLKGMTIDEIAAERSLTSTTIESHVVQGILEGKLDREGYLGGEGLVEIRDCIEEQGAEGGLKAIVNRLNGKYSYGQVRLAMKLHDAD